MATYKKRGYKPKAEKIRNTVEDPNLEENSTTAEVFNTLDETASKTEDFVAANQKNIFIFIGAIAAIVLGYLGYQKLVKEPAQAEAMNEIYYAQKQYNAAVSGIANDSLYNLVLNGTEGKYGMLDIIDKYSGTPAANLANYYAGVSYLNMQDYKNAIAHLDQFESADDALGPNAKGSIGDAFVQLEQKDQALKYYVEAAKMRNNEYTTPNYYFKAGVIALELGKTGEALGYFNTIKDNYPNVEEAKQIEVFIAKAKAMSNR